MTQRAAPPTTRHIGPRDNGGPIIVDDATRGILASGLNRASKALLLLKLIGFPTPDKPKVSTAAWTQELTDAERREMEVDAGRMHRKRRSLRELEQKQSRRMNMCISRARRKKGKT